MRFEGVTFVEEHLMHLTKKEFILKFYQVFWLDRNVKERKKMLSDAYDLMVKQQPKG